MYLHAVPVAQSQMLLLVQNTKPVLSHWSQWGFRLFVGLSNKRKCDIFVLVFGVQMLKKTKTTWFSSFSLIWSTLSQTVHSLLETFWAWIQLMTQLKIASSLPYFPVKLFILAGRAGGESRTGGIPAFSWHFLLVLCLSFKFAWHLFCSHIGILVLMGFLLYWK